MGIQKTRRILRKKKINKWGIGGTLQDPSEENATPRCLLPLIYI